MKTPFSAICLALLLAQAALPAMAASADKTVREIDRFLTAWEAALQKQAAGK